MEKKILITGCARSGTRYISNVLRRCGVKVGHEYTDDDGSATHFFPIESDAYPFFPWEKPPKAHVGERFSRFAFQHHWHQVREPLKVIGSCRVIVPKSEWKWLGSHFSPMKKYSGSQDRTTTSMAYWYYFNLFCEEHATWTYRIEDIDHVWVRFQTSLGIHKPIPNTSRELNRAKRFNQPWTSKEQKEKNAENPTWDELYSLDPILTGNCQRLAVRYGYDV